jgi:hypothetical protein
MISRPDFSIDWYKINHISTNYYGVLVSDSRDEHILLDDVFRPLYFSQHRECPKRWRSGGTAVLSGVQLARTKIWLLVPR